ncbi:MAG: RnfABCDGE type electron transport complex subunit D [Gammaproteobacteria bacterium]
MRAPATTASLQLEFLLASTPAVLIGIWSLGSQVALSQAADAPAPGWAESFGVGLSVFAPLLAVSILTSAVWAVVFARLRQRPLDPGWVLTGWLYAALLPGALPLWAAATGISFGMVFGSQIFGGTGRYPASPVLLGVLFLTIAYPDLFGPGGWLPGQDSVTTWSLLGAEGPAALSEAGFSWLGLATGRELGGVGAVSDLACLVGGAYLVFRGWASWRTLVSACAGVWLASLVFSGSGGEGATGWHWHVVAGNFAFVLAFVATDPSTQAMTSRGRLLHGALAGALAISFRTLNPEHPEGSLFAFLLAALFTPLLDQAVLFYSSRSGRAGAARS